jgi:hypothetical protein
MAFRPYLKMKRDSCGSEHRRVTILAINMDIDNLGT